MGRSRAPSGPPAGLTFDTGALLALERHDARMIALLDRLSAARSFEIAIPAPVLAQAWRGSARQAPIARLLALDGVEIVPLDAAVARAIGLLCGATRTRDVVDAAVVLCARERGHRVVTSDPDDVLRLDPSLDRIAL